MLSSGNNFTEIIIDKSPSTLIIGNNGSGKSTFLDALTFVLFGVAYRNINKPNLINSVNDRDLVVELEFRIGLKEYLIRRGLKPGIFEIHENGVMLNQNSDIRDYQKYLEENILGFNCKSFTQIVILGSALFVPFMQLKPPERRLILDNLLDIQILSFMGRITGIKLSDLKLVISDTKKNIDSVNSQIELQKKYVQDSKKNNEKLLQDLNDEYNSIITDIELRINQIKDIQKNINNLFHSIEDEDNIKSKLKTLYDLETKIEENRKKKLKEANFFSANSSCPLCEQDIDVDFKGRKIRENVNKVKEFETAISTLQNDQNSLNVRLSEITVIQKEIRKKQSEITVLNTSNIESQKQANKILAEISSNSSKTVLSEEMMQISQELVDNLEKLNLEQKANFDKKLYLDAIGIILKDDGIKSKIVKQYLPVINTLVNKYLAAMDFFVNFEIDEQFETIIKSRHRDILSYLNFSEGEKARIDLAFMFAWRAVAKIKNTMNTNLLILDEVFDGSLDTSGSEELMKIINTFDCGGNVFIISHKNDIMIDKFNSIIKFEKVGNFSRISEDKIK